MVSVFTKGHWVYTANTVGQAMDWAEKNIPHQTWNLVDGEHNPQMKRLTKFASQ